MTRKLARISAVLLAVGVVGAGGVAVAVAGPDAVPSVPGVVESVTGDDDAPLTGDTLDKAVAAAKAAAGEGTVTDTEHDDNGYEVEIRRPDGTQVEVDLDRAFTVLGSEVDDDSDEDRSDGDDADD
jgi:hypothetical protein